MPPSVLPFKRAEKLSSETKDQGKLGFDQDNMQNEANALLKDNEWAKAIEAFGTAYIFEKRAEAVKWKLKLLTFTGLALPLLLGGVALRFGQDSILFWIVYPLAGTVGIAQLALSLWSVVSGWNDAMAYSLESMTHNYRLSTLFSDLAKSRKSNKNDEEKRFQVLIAEYRVREDADLKKQVSEKEKRKGMRAALRQFRKSCYGCGEVPTSMDLKSNPKSENCPVCGNY